MASTATAERTERAGTRNGHDTSYQKFRSQREQEDRQRVRGDWVPADGSDNTLELAETDDPDLIAVRNSYNHGRMIFATRSQLRALCRASTGDEQLRDLLRS